ncbi:hypothetical protein ACVR0S_01085 [Streptococcus dentapri]|uniref:Uncharacterized protein n=1 Tax=Streptococcus dentapri TaxID=573564 RepID=A0ABV8D1E5_9STRE
MPIEELKILFKSSNRTVAILHLINLILNILTIFVYFIVMYGLKSGFYQKTGQFSAQSLETITQALSGNFFFNLLINILFNLTIMILAFNNKSKLAQGKELNVFPHQLGYALLIINSLAEFMSGGLSINFFLQLFYLPFYFASLRAARLINNSI